LTQVPSPYFVSLAFDLPLDANGLTIDHQVDRQLHEEWGLVQRPLGVPKGPKADHNEAEDTCQEPSYNLYDDPHGILKFR
jgi:hypothetical protein